MNKTNQRLLTALLATVITTALPVAFNVTAKQFRSSQAYYRSDADSSTPLSNLCANIRKSF